PALASRSFDARSLGCPRLSLLAPELLRSPAIGTGQSLRQLRGRQGNVARQQLLVAMRGGDAPSSKELPPFPQFDAQFAVGDQQAVVQRAAILLTSQGVGSELELRQLELDEAPGDACVEQLIGGGADFYDDLRSVLRGGASPRVGTQQRNQQDRKST